jgi:zinc protease
MLRRSLWRTPLWLLVLSPAVLSAQILTHEVMLDNGLKLIVKEDHRAPVVVSQVWYKVGNSYEHNGITGLSHLLEHMMFKGTEKHPAGEFSRILSEQGGEQNAFTGRDYTAYYQRLEKSKLAVSFELEADRMRNLALPEKEFKKERQVVIEERRLRTEDDPEALAYERFNAVAFLNSPYRNPVIGWMSDLQELTLDDVRNWYQTWYAPNNATVVVVGDVDPQQVLALAKKHFGPLQPRRIPVPRSHHEAEQRGQRSIQVHAPAKVPYLIMGYPVEVLKTIEQETGGPDRERDWEPYALTVMEAILADGDSSWFAKNLVRGSEVAASAGASYSLYSRMQDLLVFDGVPAEGRTVAELEQAMRAEIKRIREEPVSEEELARVKAQVTAQKVFERDSLFYQAMQIGTLETVGLDHRLLDELLPRIQAVTAHQVQEVARKYLVDQRLTRAELMPEPEEEDGETETEQTAATIHEGADNVH